MSSLLNFDIAFVQFFSLRIPQAKPSDGKDIRQSILVEDSSGVVRVDPRKILRILLRDDVLSKIDAAGDGYDYGEIRKSAKGKLKGGKMKKRDKRFGYRGCKPNPAKSLGVC
jgi:hypothetical protein